MNSLSLRLFRNKLLQGAHRQYSSSSSKYLPKKSVTSADTRLAGRLRFYKQVGVVEVAPPWEEQSSPQLHTSTVESPISAGVDGTDSASGVHHAPTTKKSASEWKHMLSPRRPGTLDLVAADDLQWFGVTLDGRTMKTPMGLKLSVPSESLAYAIAAEWDAQEKKLQPADMPLMSLACTALDQVSHHPHVYREQSLNFLPTDTTCFWADPTEDRVLHRRQEQAWKELHEFVETSFEYPPAVAVGASEGLLMARKRDNKPSVGLPHPPNLMEQATRWVHTLDAWQLVALSSMCSQAKSFLVAWAALEPGSPLSDVAKALSASRVEEEFQIASWGLVEGGHDYDRLNASVSLYSAKLFAKAISMDNQLDP